MVKLFSETEKLIGYITTATGSLLLIDGAFQTAVKAANRDIVCLDVEKEQSRIPVFTVMQNNKRFILVSIDDAVPADYPTSERVEAISPADLPELPEPTSEG